MVSAGVGEGRGEGEGCNSWVLSYRCGIDQGIVSGEQRERSRSAVSLPVSLAEVSIGRFCFCSPASPQIATGRLLINYDAQPVE